MQIAMFFSRRKSRRPAPRPRREALVADWTTRDWADLPICHPRKD